MPVTTRKAINLAQLAEEVGVALRGRFTETEATIEAIDGAVADPALQAAIDAHTADDEYGMEVREREIVRVRKKARDVLAGTDSFTANQVQKLLAALVLKETR